MGDPSARVFEVFLIVLDGAQGDLIVSQYQWISTRALALVSMFLCNQSYTSHGRLSFLLGATILNFNGLRMPCNLHVRIQRDGRYFPALRPPKTLNLTYHRGVGVA